MCSQVKCRLYSELYSINCTTELSRVEARNQGCVPQYQWGLAALGVWGELPRY